jgi:hypothetical protein
MFPPTLRSHTHTRTGGGKISPEVGAGGRAFHSEPGFLPVPFPIPLCPKSPVAAKSHRVVDAPLGGERGDHALHGLPGEHVQRLAAAAAKVHRQRHHGHLTHIQGGNRGLSNNVLACYVVPY